LVSGKVRAASSRMSAPRPVFPGSFISITRRCTQRQFLLRPDDETNNAFVYCLADAAQRTGVQVILSQMESNHHHTAAYDPDGRHPEFREHLHKMMAKCQNALRGRWENMWSSEESCVVEVITAEDLLNQLVYIAINPVKDGLVEKVHHWPGPNFVRALLRGKPLKATRPRHFFRDEGSMPEQLELVLGLPDHVEHRATFLAELERRIAEVENNVAQERTKTGRQVLGRRRILRQSWRDSPDSREPRRNLRPRFAGQDPATRFALIERNRQWRACYVKARAAMLAGEQAQFPYGTYWLRRFVNVTVTPPPESNRTALVSRPRGAANKRAPPVRAVAAWRRSRSEPMSTDGPGSVATPSRHTVDDLVASTLVGFSRRVLWFAAQRGRE